MLSLAPARVDPRRVFGSMGLGSLGAMELRNRLEALLRRPLSATLAWNYPTVDALSAYLAGDAKGGQSTGPLSGAMVAAAGAGASGAAASGKAAPNVAAAVSDLSESLTQVAVLSDEEALLALRGSRTKGGR